MRVMAWLHRLLLRLYPRSFREDFGAEMTVAFLDTLRSRPTTAARAMLVARAVADAFASAAAERTDERRRLRGARLRYEPSQGSRMHAVR